MPNPRRAIQEQHERFQVGLLIEELNRRHRARFRVVAEPNPPEAIIRSGLTTRWVEVVTAYWSEEYARDLNSYATPDEVHVPVGSGPFMSIDVEFVGRLLAAVKSKLEKETYVPIREKHGPGYLLVSIHHPFMAHDTLQLMRENWQQIDVNDLGCFRSVYITYRLFEGYRVMRWT